MAERPGAAPSFSLLIEPYNLRSTGLARLRECLNSIAGESPSPAEANEALLLDEGGLPPATARALEEAYPWLRLHRIPAGLGYGDVKALGAEGRSRDLPLRGIVSAGWARPRRARGRGCRRGGRRLAERRRSAA